MKSFSATVGQLSIEDVQVDGAEIAYINSDSAWKAKALETLYALCLRNRVLCADDLVFELDHAEEKTTSLNAITGVFRAGIKNGWIEHRRCSCGEECATTVSMREGNNKRRILLYNSLIFKRIM